MNIIGINFSNRIKLLNNIERRLSNEKKNIDITILEDEKYLLKYGISNTPAIVIYDKVIS